MSEGYFRDRIEGTSGCYIPILVHRMNLAAITDSVLLDHHHHGDLPMPISTDMIVRIAHADIAMHMAFPRSVAHWQRERDKDHAWQIHAGDCDALLIGQHDAVAIDGNCSNSVSAPEGGIIHIYGDLTSAIDAAGHYEIIVTGNVARGATIRADGFCRVFVGGRFDGELRSSSSSKLWIDSDFFGTVKTGTPSTEIYIGRDFNGNITPNETASLLWLTVAGFASHASLSKIVDCEYTQFNASIGRGDVAPGIYPIHGRVKKSSGGNSFNRWCVATKIGT